MLVIMYSKSLQTDSEKRFPSGQVPKAKRKNCPARIYTLHGFFTGMYGPCFDDSTLNGILSANTPRRRPFNYDYVIVDECQDLKDKFYEGILKILSDNDNPCPVIMRLGDRRQEIFTYEGADSRYFLGGDKAYELFSSRPWVRIVLKTTYRLDDEHCAFVNRVILKEDCFRSAGRAGEKPILVRSDPYTWIDNVLRVCNGRVHVKGRRSLGGILPSDILVLASSLRGAGSRSPPRRLSNWFSEHKLAVFYPTGSEDNRDTASGKVIFSSFHQAKGMEKRLVILLGADESWYEHAGREITDRDQVPCAWVVALTRAKDQLIMIQDASNAPLPFGNWEAGADTYELRDMAGPTSAPAIVRSNRQKKMSITELLRHQPWYDMDAARVQLCVEKLPNATSITGVKTVIDGTDGITQEDVSDIIGRTVGLWTDQRTHGKITWGTDGISPDISDLDAVQSLELTGLLDGKPKNVDVVFRIATFIYSIEEGLTHRLRQIPDDVCVLEPHINDIDAKMDELGECQKLNIPLTKEIGGVQVNGRLDALDRRGNSWALRFSQATNPDQLLHVGIAHHLLASEMGDEVLPTLLANLRSGERYQVTVLKDFGQALGQLVFNKTKSSPARKSDADFYAEMEQAAQLWAKRRKNRLLQTEPFVRAPVSVEGETKARERPRGRKLKEQSVGSAAEVAMLARYFGKMNVNE